HDESLGVDIQIPLQERRRVHGIEQLAELTDMNFDHATAWRDLVSDAHDPVGWHASPGVGHPSRAGPLVTGAGGEHAAGTCAAPEGHPARCRGRRSDWR